MKHTLTLLFALALLVPAGVQADEITPSPAKSESLPVVVADRV